MIRDVGASVAVILIWVALPLAGTAQDVGIHGARLDPDHGLLGNPAGIGGAFNWNAKPWIGLRVEYTRAHDGFESFGSTCVGLSIPEECGAEDRAETASIDSWSMSLPVTLELGARIRLSFVPGIRRVHFDSAQRGRVSGRVRRATKNVLGPQAGIELRARVSRSVPIAVTLGGYVANLPWFEEVQIVDGYTPFEQSVSISWIQIGLTIPLAEIFGP